MARQRKLHYAWIVAGVTFLTLLVAAGLQLQLLRLDHPAAAAQVNEVLAALEGAMDHVRELSQELAPSPFSPRGS